MTISRHPRTLIDILRRREGQNDQTALLADTPSVTSGLPGAVSTTGGALEPAQAIEERSGDPGGADLYVGRVWDIGGQPYVYSGAAKKFIRVGAAALIAPGELSRALDGKVIRATGVGSDPAWAYLLPGDLDPSGSTAGEAIVSTGSGSAPTWAAVSGGGGGGSGSGYKRPGPDVPPATAHAMDDEFNTTALDAKWTIDPNGATDIDTSYPSCFYRDTSVAGTSAIKQAVPAGDFVMWGKFQYEPLSLAACSGGLAVGVAGGDRHVFSAAQGAINVNRLTSGWGFVSNLFGTTPWASRTSFVYLAIKRIGSTLTFAASADGVTWGQVLSTAQVASTDTVWLFADTGSRAAGTKFVCDYVRFNTTSVPAGVGDWTTVPVDTGTSGLSKIAQVVLGADTATIDFSSIPANFEDLRVVLLARLDTVATSDDVVMRFNNDSAAHYDALHHVDIDYRDNGVTYMNVGTFAAASAPADAADIAIIDIPNYARTVFQKVAHASSTTKQSTAATYSSHSAMWWRDTSAITRITLLPVTAGKKFKAGSVGTLYGIGGA